MRILHDSKPCLDNYAFHAGKNSFLRTPCIRQVRMTYCMASVRRSLADLQQSYVCMPPFPPYGRETSCGSSHPPRSSSFPLSTSEWPEKSQFHARTILPKTFLHLFRGEVAGNPQLHEYEWSISFCRVGSILSLCVILSSKQVA